MKYLSTLIICLAVMTALTTPVSAHILSSQGDIGGIIHLTPDDDPYVLELTEGSIEIKDRTGKFKASDCDCELIIYKAGKEIFRDDANIRQDDISAVAKFNYTFPSKDIYTISLIGKPQGEAKFSEFELKYDFRITREIATGTQTNPVAAIAVIGTLAAILIAGGYFMVSRTNQASKAN